MVGDRVDEFSCWADFFQILVSLEKFDDCYLGFRSCELLTDAITRACPEAHHNHVEHLLTGIPPSFRVKLERVLEIVLII